MRTYIASITTHSKSENNWKAKLKEVEQLGLTQIGLFLTGLDTDERKVCFHELVKLKNRIDFTIPFVHAVSSMKEVEYRFLQDCFGTKKFNLHPLTEFPLQYSLSDAVREDILIETASACVALTARDMEGFGGVCVDVAHLDDMRRNHFDEYEKNLELFNQFKVQANHISAVAMNVNERRSCCEHRSVHRALTEDNFSYLSFHPAQAYADIVALELENSMAEQLHFLEIVENRIELKQDNLITQVAA